MSDFHLVSSYSACGSLRHAITENLLTGKVGLINDDFSVGPLDLVEDGRTRAIFWQKIAAMAYPDGDIDRSFDDAFSSWLEVRNMMRDMQPDRILIWASSSGSEYVFLRIACRMLADVAAPLHHVAVPPKNNFCHIAEYSPEELAPMAAHARHLRSSEKDALALEFDIIAARPELLRECDENGQLRFGHLGDHDDLLVTALRNEWQLGPRVIGEAMGKSDPRNGFGDTMLAARLRHLIESGVAEEEYRAEPKTWRNWYVRQKNKKTNFPIHPRV